MRFSDLRQFPGWLLLSALGAAALAVGAARELVIAGNAIRLEPPLNYILVLTGLVFVGTGIYELRLASTTNRVSLPVDSVSIDVLDVVHSSGNARAGLQGTVTPPVGGVKIWILREELSASPGMFHVGARPALTDKNGEWQQFTNLWGGGKFRIHAVVADDDAELLFAYYRKAFEKARDVYRWAVDPDADSFPDWPFLERLPNKHVSVFRDTAG